MVSPSWDELKEASSDALWESLSGFSKNACNVSKLMSGRSIGKTSPNDDVADVAAVVVLTTGVWPAEAVTDRDASGTMGVGACAWLNNKDGGALLVTNGWVATGTASCAEDEEPPDEALRNL